MHGLIFHELRSYVNQTASVGTWSTIIDSAGLKGKMYLQVQIYPDHEFEALIEEARKAIGIFREDLLINFGRYIMPKLLRIFGHIILAEWKLMDVLEHTENVIHKTIRQYDKNAQPPYLECKRIGVNEVRIYYNSPRNMLGFGKGLVLGLSDHYKETVSITESTEQNKKVLHIRKS